jgi:hypothetical protein
MLFCRRQATCAHAAARAAARAKYPALLPNVICITQGECWQIKSAE